LPGLGDVPILRDCIVGERMTSSEPGPGPGPGLLSRLSIERKLPVFVSFLILAIILSFSWAAYRGMRATALGVARGRLGSVAEQLSRLLTNSGKQLTDTLARLAAEPDLRRYLAAPSGPGRARALAALSRSGPQPAQIVATELWSAERRRLLVSPEHESARPSGPQAEVIRWPPDPTTSAVGRFLAVADTIMYPVVAPVADGDRLLGYVVRWRRITGSPQGREQLAKLIGSSSALYIGNDRGPFWTDLVDTVAGPPMEVRGTTKAVEYRRPATGPVLAVSRPIPGTPWVVLLEFSRTAVLAPVRGFVQRLTVAGLVLLAVGLAVTWLMAHRIAKPLRQLTGAAKAMAAGDYSHAVTVARRDELGQLAGAFNAMADQVQHAQRRLEQQVRERTAALQERNEELEAFAYSISHDLRAPLRAMQGFSQALLEDAGDQLDAEGRDYARRIVGAAGRMDELIRDLLAYSRVSREDLELTPVPLGPVSRAAAQEVEGEVAARGGRVVVDESLPTVLGHRATLSQVLANLIGNGIKFVPTDRVPEVVVRAERTNGLVRLVVEDNGIGIAAEHRDRIFRVFERLHSTAEYSGTGIGLAIVRKAVERMGGRVGVESTTGSGSRFWVELRAAGEAT
jgi:signal transduction histidine kinase